MSLAKEQLLIKLGFRFGASGPHSARTMMLDDLRVLFAHVPADGTRADYSQAVCNENILGKPTKKSRELALRHLTSLYGLDAQIPLFRTLRRLWPLDTDAQPVLALTAALARGKQEQALKDYCEAHYPHAKNDLANVFLERCLELSVADSGVVQIVMPQNWLFLTSYKKQREDLLRRVRWDLLARLGEGGFDSPQAAGAFIILLTQTNTRPQSHPLPEGAGVPLGQTAGSCISGVDASAPRTAQAKAQALMAGELKVVSQWGQLGNPDARVAFDEGSSLPLLGDYAAGLVGLQTSDDPMFIAGFWEFSHIDDTTWEYLQGTPEELTEFAGCSWLVRWEKGEGLLLSLPTARPTQGAKAIGRKGVAIHRMRVLFPYRFASQRLHQNVAVIISKDDSHLPAIWCFCSSPDYNEAVRRIDQKLNVTNATLVKVPFDLAHWSQVAAERYPNGLPKPYSDDPTQWLFHGHPVPATDPLQVAVARLMGYVWPAETDANMELSDEAHAWIARCKPLAKHTDDDGIVCLQPVRGEQPAHERLLALLIDAWETTTSGSWTPSVLEKLLAQADCAGKGLAVWLRDSFFEQHAKRFQHRPFIWHVWDGQKDGFGAPLRLAAAQNLKIRLQAILEGEAPYDIFVRWKPLHAQPIGWNPDLNDGIRLNIRPFMTAEVLRHNKKPKLNITWDKDRGKDVVSAPWFKVFGGERINDHHVALAVKIAAKQHNGDQHATV